MAQFIWAFVEGMVPALPFLGIIILAALIYWLFANRDRFRHPEEYKDKGSTGEQLIYLALKKYGIDEKQFLRNVYVPTDKGTTEIDLLVLSKKGVLIFECKNYSGNIYGDGKRKKWIQYLGKTKNYFLSPVLQNRYHVKCLKEFLAIPNLPIIPFIATTTNGKWKVRNLSPDDHFLQYKGQLIEIYNALPNSEVMAQQIQQIYHKLKPLSRPSADIRKQHLDDLKARH